MQLKASMQATRRPCLLCRCHVAAGLLQVCAAVSMQCGKLPYWLAILPQDAAEDLEASLVPEGVIEGQRHLVQRNLRGQFLHMHANGASDLCCWGGCMTGLQSPVVAGFNASGMP